MLQQLCCVFELHDQLARVHRVAGRRQWRCPPAGGIAIDTTWGYQQAQWIPTQVYGINWQAQRNIDPNAGPPLKTEIWVDDVYFVE